MTSTKSIAHIFVLGLALFVLFGYHYIGADWTAPLSAPPICNAGDPGCDPPINTSSSNQIKTGDITAVNLKAGNEMWSQEYCDETGSNCINLSSCSVGDVLVRSASGWQCAAN